MFTTGGLVSSSLGADIAATESAIRIFALGAGLIFGRLSATTFSRIILFLNWRGATVISINVNAPGRRRTGSTGAITWRKYHRRANTIRAAVHLLAWLAAGVRTAAITSRGWRGAAATIFVSVTSGATGRWVASIPSRHGSSSLVNSRRLVILVEARRVSFAACTSLIRCFKSAKVRRNAIETIL